MRIEVSATEKAELIEQVRKLGDWMQTAPCDERSLRAFYHGQGIGQVRVLHHLGILDDAEQTALMDMLYAHRGGGE